MRNALVKSFFDQTSLYLDNSFAVAIRSLIVRELLGPLQGQRILDIGCGNGGVSLPYASSENTLTLLDLSDQMLKLAHDNTPSQFRQNVAYLNLDFLEFTPSEPFDVILCLGVLAHLPSDEVGIRKLVSLVKPNGTIILQFTDQENLIAKINRLYYVVRQRLKPRYQYRLNLTTATAIRNVIAANGLRTVDERHYSLLLPGMGNLPHSFVSRIQMASLRNRLLSSLGSEVILKLTPNQQPS